LLFEVGLLRATTRILQNKHIHRRLEVDQHFKQHTYQPSIADTVEFHIWLVNETCMNSPNTSVQAVWFTELRPRWAFARLDEYSRI